MYVCVCVFVFKWLLFVRFRTQMIWMCFLWYMDCIGGAVWWSWCYRNFLTECFQIKSNVSLPAAHPRTRTSCTLDLLSFTNRKFYCLITWFVASASLFISQLALIYCLSTVCPHTSTQSAWTHNVAKWEFVVPFKTRKQKVKSNQIKKNQAHAHETSNFPTNYTEESEKKWIWRIEGNDGKEYDGGGSSKKITKRIANKININHTNTILCMKKKWRTNRLYHCECGTASYNSLRNLEKTRAHTHKRP